MEKQHRIVIAGAGGIAEAAALILAEWSRVAPKLFVGDLYPEKAQKVARWVEEGASRPCSVTPYHLPLEGVTEEMKSVFSEGDILLDCLPGGAAPRMAQFAKDFGMHYANLTEYVASTNKIMELAKDAKTGFALQSGLAPGYIDVLAHGLFLDFCRDFGVEKADKLEFKVGALTDHAIAPHFYGFTWSPIGVATEYLEDAIVVRDYKKTLVPSLSDTGSLIIDGIAYEDNLTSGGAADLPDALAGKVKNLDYKTLRSPGHYSWVKQQIEGRPDKKDRIAYLQKIMEEHIPHIEDDRILLYAAVEGKDRGGVLRRREFSRLIKPQKVGRYTLRAIQTTTASAMLQAAMYALESGKQGLILQSHIDPKPFLNGDFVSRVYGKV